MNENVIWSNTIANECMKLGVKYACIGAGSRSTPLTLAFAKSKIISLPFVDERSAGFFALGIAKYSGKPVVLICTSGTALANFYPAVLEAFYNRVPLLILSADRPHELRKSGANQTMDQIKFFGSHVRYFEDFPTPDAQPLPESYRGLRTSISRAYAVASSTPMGPVHLNFPFRKPLEPIASRRKFDPSLLDSETLEGRSDPYLNTLRGKLVLDPSIITMLIEKFQSIEKGIIIAGPKLLGVEYQKELLDFADFFKYPVLADPSSSIRYGTDSDFVISSYETFLSKNTLKCDIILILENPPTSTFLLRFLNNSSAEKIVICDSEGKDSSLTASLVLNTDPKSFFSACIKNNGKREVKWIDSWKTLDKQTITRINSLTQDNFFEGSILQKIFSQLNNESYLFIGNSLSIRHMDQFVFKTDKKVHVYCNRGLSGIDGTISSASGISFASGEKVHLILGDLSFYHDITALLQLMKFDVDLNVYLMNNKGGGIFHRLPISQFEPEFTQYFVTPQEIDFSKIVEAFGLEYEEIKTLSQINSGINSAGSKVYEFVIDRIQSHKLIEKLHSLD